MDWFDTILYPIMVAVAWIMVGVHDLLVAVGMSGGSGWAWVLSIVGLTIVIRILIIPLFFKQIKAARGMQLVQPEMQKLQKKYKGKTDPASRQKMQEEMMALYREHGTNPFASCLPILLQMPIFFALFRVLNSLGPLSQGTYAGGSKDSIGPLTQELAAQAESSTLFGAPNNVDVSACCASCCVSGPIASRGYSPRDSGPREFSTRNSAKKMGICSRIGRQEANGFVPCSR